MNNSYEKSRVFELCIDEASFRCPFAFFQMPPDHLRLSSLLLLFFDLISFIYRHLVPRYFFDLVPSF